MARSSEPREPREPRDPYDGGYDPGGYDPGRYDPGAYDPGHYERGSSERATPTRGGYTGGPGPYGSEPEYGWQQPDYEPAGGYGAGPPPGTDTYRDTYRPQQGRREPSWAPGVAQRQSARGRRPRWILPAVAAAAVAVLLVLGFLTPGWFVTRVFDTAAVQNGVAKVLTDDYGAEGVADVRCPENIGVTAEATFTCDATIDGDPVTVPVRVTDGSGRYEVGRPT